MGLFRRVGERNRCPSQGNLDCGLWTHIQVKEAAVIALPSKKWMERPCACVVLHPGQTLTLEELRKFLEPKVGRMSLPDALELFETIPKTSVGKFSKLDLRKLLAGKTLP